MTKLEARARFIADEANQCCNRSDGYEDDIYKFALKMLQEAVAEAKAWQPVETAPKDGTFIWLLSDSFAIRIGYWKGGRWVDLAKAEARGACDLSFEPSHWMPLPEPPK